MGKTTPPKNSKALATFLAKLTDEKIASNIVVMDLAEHEAAPADYFVMCSTESDSQSRAILDLVMRQSKKADIDKPKVEGESSGEWILVDFFDVVLHIMLASVREYYQVEELWSNATLYTLNTETGRLIRKK